MQRHELTSPAQLRSPDTSQRNRLVHLCRGAVHIVARPWPPALLVASLVVLLSCSASRELVPSASVPGEVYDRLYPHHVEVCAVSQIRPLDAPFGGSAGHAAMYLSGVCPVR